VSLLTLYVKTKEHSENYSRPPPDLIEGKEKYKVEAIRSHQRHGKKKQLQYLIKWKGYPKSDNTWELEENLHAPHLIKEYHRCRLSSSIKGALGRAQQDPSPSWQPLTTPAPPTNSLNPRLPSLTCLCPPGTLTMTPSLHPLLSSLINAVRKAIARRRPSPSLLSTSIPMPPSATTSTALSIAKCLKYLIRPVTLHLLSQPQHHPAHLTMPHPTTAMTPPSPLTPSLPTLSLPWGLTENPQREPHSMSHTPPHPWSKKSCHHCSVSLLLTTPTPLSHLVWHKPSSTSAKMSSVRLCELWPLALPTPSSGGPPLPPNSSQQLGSISTICVTLRVGR